MPLWTEEFATASWWPAVAKRDGDGRREYRWFVVERGDGFPTSQRYEALGLKAIDYGVNDIDAFVPAHRCIDVGKGNLSSMVDIHLSGRALIGAMACGFLRRVAREAHAYADARRIGRSPLSAIGYVRCRLEAVDGAGGDGCRCGSPTNTKLDLAWRSADAARWTSGRPPCDPAARRRRPERDESKRCQGRCLNARHAACECSCTACRQEPAPTGPERGWRSVRRVRPWTGDARRYQAS